MNLIALATDKKTSKNTSDFKGIAEIKLLLCSYTCKLILSQYNSN